MKTLTKAEFMAALVGGVDVSCVWAKELQELIKKNDALKEEVTLLRMKMVNLEEENQTLKNATENFTFVRLYA